MVTDESQIPSNILTPNVRLIGEVSEDMARDLIACLDDASNEGEPLIVELTTLGGDAEIARRMALELDLARERIHPRRIVFLGKTTIYSAGATIMGAFPRNARFVTEDSWLMIHGRQLDKEVSISGPMRASLAEVEALQQQIKLGLAIEEHGFKRLIAGSRVSLDDICSRAQHNWYLSAQEACERGLIASTVPVPDPISVE